MVEIIGKSSTETMKKLIDFLEEVDIEHLYDRLEDLPKTAPDHDWNELLGNIIQWRLGLKEHPFTIKENDQRRDC